MVSSVVRLHEAEAGIFQITMEDRLHRNMFSEELIAGLRSAYAEIDANPGGKAVILTGYDSYFASGGTRETLLSLQEGRSRFTDWNVYSLALNCKIPVISAMQGHGIGGGFVLGLFSDMIVLSMESVYNTNFMKYGFTPGFGSTLIVPHKLGHSLAQEMLLGAGNYRGADLQRRGVPFPVLPRNEVLEHAYGLAQQLAEKPRISLMTLKAHLTASLRKDLPEYVEQELAMHEKTFLQDEVRDRIMTLFEN
ncbi:polyketide synthase [Paenibacillus kobensis]|uniref:polyketide synthase n=1 Tax=Paenibacillus kobensis TaxID=59841 RepID=UPI000FDCBAA7|nr:polyketide synthase [Paenibacillus kobensis]